MIYLSGSVANEEVGLPLRIFGRGNLCHPYLSLSYIDALSQPCVRGYIIGKFRQRRLNRWKSQLDLGCTTGCLVRVVSIQNST